MNEFKSKLISVISGLEDCQERISQAEAWFAVWATKVDGDKTADILESMVNKLSDVGLTLELALDSLDNIE